MEKGEECVRKLASHRELSKISFLLFLLTPAGDSFCSAVRISALHLKCFLPSRNISLCVWLWSCRWRRLSTWSTCCKMPNGSLKVPKATFLRADFTASEWCHRGRESERRRGEETMNHSQRDQWPSFIPINWDFISRPCRSFAHPRSFVTTESREYNKSGQIHFRSHFTLTRRTAERREEFN